MVVDVATVAAVSGALANLLTLIAVAIRVEHRLTALETTIKILLHDRRGQPTE